MMNIQQGILNVEGMKLDGISAFYLLDFGGGNWFDGGMNKSASAILLLLIFGLLGIWLFRDQSDGDAVGGGASPKKGRVLGDSEIKETVLLEPRQNGLGGSKVAKRKAARDAKMSVTKWRLAEGARLEDLLMEDIPLDDLPVEASPPAPRGGLAGVFTDAQMELVNQRLSKSAGRGMGIDDFDAVREEVNSFQVGRTTYAVSMVPGADGLTVEVNLSPSFGEEGNTSRGLNTAATIWDGQTIAMANGNEVAFIKVELEKKGKAGGNREVLE